MTQQIGAAWVMVSYCIYSSRYRWWLNLFEEYSYECQRPFLSMDSNRILLHSWKIKMELKIT